MNEANAAGHKQQPPPPLRAVVGMSYRRGFDLKLECGHDAIGFGLYAPASIVCGECTKTATQVNAEQAAQRVEERKDDGLSCSNKQCWEPHTGERFSVARGVWCDVKPGYVWKNVCGSFSYYDAETIKLAAVEPAVTPSESAAGLSLMMADQRVRLSGMCADWFAAKVDAHQLAARSQPKGIQKHKGWQEAQGYGVSLTEMEPKAAPIDVFAKYGVINDFAKITPQQWATDIDMYRRRGKSWTMVTIGRPTNTPMLASRIIIDELNAMKNREMRNALDRARVARRLPYAGCGHLSTRGVDPDTWGIVIRCNDCGAGRDSNLRWFPASHCGIVPWRVWITAPKMNENWMKVIADAGMGPTQPPVSRLSPKAIHVGEDSDTTAAAALDVERYGAAAWRNGVTIEWKDMFINPETKPGAFKRYQGDHAPDGLDKIIKPVPGETAEQAGRWLRGYQAGKEDWTGRDSNRKLIVLPSARDVIGETVFDVLTGDLPAKSRTVVSGQEKVVGSLQWVQSLARERATQLRDLGHECSNLKRKLEIEAKVNDGLSTKLEKMRESLQRIANMHDVTLHPLVIALCNAVGKTLEENR